MGGSSESADISLRIFWSSARWIEDTKGKDALEAWANTAGFTASDFDATTHWASMAQVERLLAEMMTLCGDDDELFDRAIVHRFPESYGAFLHMVWALSTESMNNLAIKMTNNVITRVSKFEKLYSTHNTYGFRYTTTVPESRLVCRSRISAWREAPVLHGLPIAELRETKCVAWGDDCCEYHLKWVDHRALSHLLTGLGIGIVLAIGATLVEPSMIASLLIPSFCVGVAYARELKARLVRSVEHSSTVRGELRKLGQQEAETRSEIVALQQRQHEWSARMETQATERLETLERVVSGLDDLQQSRVTSLRGFSHDLRNPLFIVRANGHLLREQIAEYADPEAMAILGDLEKATGQIETMLGRLMEVATTESGIAKLAPQPVSVAPLVDTMERRLRALVHGRNIQVSVKREHDAPDQIVADPLVFDRVIDNLLTNAAKYTERGEINLTMKGERTGGLVFELKDTGRGIEKAQLAEIFRPRSSSAPRTKDSYGIGLSSAVRLLGQIGGRLEVESEPGRGSTFTAHFPGAPPSSVQKRTHEDIDGVIARVVRVA